MIFCPNCNYKTKRKIHFKHHYKTFHEGFTSTFHQTHINFRCCSFCKYKTSEKQLRLDKHIKRLHMDDIVSIFNSRFDLHASNLQGENDIVEDLRGFRDFLHKKIKTMKKKSDEIKKDNNEKLVTLCKNIFEETYNQGVQISKELEHDISKNLLLKNVIEQQLELKESECLEDQQQPELIQSEFNNSVYNNEIDELCFKFSNLSISSK